MINFTKYNCIILNVNNIKLEDGTPKINPTQSFEIK